MADIYCDMDLGTGANDDNAIGLNVVIGTSWANAYQTFSALMSATASLTGGDRVYVMGSESSSGDLTCNLGGTRSKPTEFYGVKLGTTAEPPTNSDLAIRGTDTLPETRRSGSGDSHKFTGHGYLFGIRFEDGGTMEMQSLELQLRFEGCELKVADSASAGSIEVGHETDEDGTCVVEFLDCGLEGSDAGDDRLFEAKRSAYVRVIGGEVNNGWLYLYEGGSGEGRNRIESCTG